MRNVAIIGVGQTRFGEHWDKSLRDMMFEAGHAALKDAGIARTDVHGLHVGNMSAGRFAGQEHLGALAAEALGLQVPAVRYEAACASGGLALRQATLAVASGREDVAIVLGIEKMTDVAVPSAVLSLAAAGDQEWEAANGLTFAGAYALMARRHMFEFGTTKEQLAHVAVTNHKHAVGNPFAQFPFAISLQDALDATAIADPLGLYDCSPITDGAAAVIIASPEAARRLAPAQHPIWILGSGHGSDTVALHGRKSLTELAATKQAAHQAFSSTGLAPKNIDLTEVHDCFTINEIVCLEDLGFCAKGQGGKFVESGAIGLEGEIPTNTLGGLKACGHPVGATGIRQAIDITKQLRGTAYNLVKGAKRGLSINIGGSGATAVVHIFGNEEPKK